MTVGSTLTTVVKIISYFKKVFAMKPKAMKASQMKDTILLEQKKAQIVTHISLKYQRYFSGTLGCVNHPNHYQKE